jgi:hypothetical protein
VERWTIAEPSHGRNRLHINYGGRPYWCMFDFAVVPAPGTDGVEVGLAADADAASAEWSPHLRRGMLRGLEADREQGREWVAVRVEVRKIHAHPVDTTVRGCERYGFTFILEELPARGVPLPEQRQAEPGVAPDPRRQDDKGGA